MSVMMVFLISNKPTKGTLRNSNNSGDNMSDEIRQNPPRLYCHRGLIHERNIFCINAHHVHPVKC